MIRNNYRFISLAVSGCLLVLLAACGPFGPADSGTTPTPSTNGSAATPTTGGVTATPRTVTMPATRTDCPTAGTARAAVFAPLVLGTHQNIVYTFNQGASPSHTSGVIKRYDAPTGKKVIIVNSPNSSIYEGQVSEDGQWILFTTLVSGKKALQLVRMDGQGLQTLHCSSTDLFSIQWSPNQKTVVFMEGSDLSSATVDLLDLATGHLQEELVAPTAGGIGASPATWLDDTHIYMTSFVPFSGAPPQSLYALDTAKGANQHASDLIKVFDSSGFCLGFDSSFDNSKIFVSKCNAMFAPGSNPIQQGPSTLISEPALGGPPTTIYTNPTLAITTVRVISSTTMLLVIQNLNGDTSKNGLWKMNLDSTGLMRLTTTGAGQMSSLNETSQFTWSNISRDASMYALKISSINGTTESLLLGSLGGSSSSTFASFSGVGSVNIVGWTKM